MARRIHLLMPGLFLLAAAILMSGFGTGHMTTPYRFPAMMYFPRMPQPADNPATVEGAALGRYLFYDPILSRDSSFSCASCHHQSSAFSDAPRRFSTGLRGDQMTRNTPPLFNLAWHPALFWDGRAASIEEQVLHPVRTPTEMDMSWAGAAARINHSDFYRSKFQAAFGNERIDSVLISKAIAQFLRTLISCNSKYDSVLRGEAEFSHDEFEGQLLINNQVKANCMQCHTTDGDALSTTLQFSNSGLDTVQDPLNYKDKGRGAVTGRISDYGKFKVPSLRNVAITAPYMHDGRFVTLAEVLDFYSEGLHPTANIDPRMVNVKQGGMHLTNSDKKKIIAFLHTMTDLAFTKDPAFSDPFAKK